jgi:hypothetical protein
LIDRRGLREAEAFSWGAGAKTIRPSRAFLDLNRGTTNGACFSAFNVLSLVHDFSCLDVEWDTFWSGYNYSSEVCWVTPSLATVSVYLLKLGFGSGMQPRCHFLLLFFFVGLGQRPDWNVSSLYFGFLAEWSSRLAEDSVEWAIVVCDSSFLCNPLESKGGIRTYNKQGPTPSLTL